MFRVSDTHYSAVVCLIWNPVLTVSLNHDGTGIQSALPIPSASAAGPSVPSFSNSCSN